MCEGAPEPLQLRFQAALDIVKPIGRIESELVAQGFVAEEIRGIEPYRCAAEMLRLADVRTARAVLLERMKGNSSHFAGSTNAEYTAAWLR